MQSYCYIVNYSRSEAAMKRARAMAEISDGFEISEIDYEMRGPGDVMGTVQAGNVNSDILQLSRYTDILEAAAEDADQIMNDPVDETDTGYALERMMRAGASDNSDII